jgi:hypothetical protein
MNNCKPNNTQTQASTRAEELVRLPIFKPVTLAALPQIRAVLQRAPSRSCDYTVGGIALWINWFGYEYDIINNTLFIKGLAENNRHITAFSLPIGDMPTTTAVSLLKHYCELHGTRLTFSAIPEDCLDLFADYTNTSTEPLEAWSDYIYSAEDLATLAGKKFQKKRNHVNRFITENPHYRVEDITDNNISEVAAYFASLQHDDNSPMALYERQAVSRLLADGNIPHFDSALLRDDNARIVAFTFGEVIGDTLHVHIEKMSHDVNGAGAAINKMFVERMMQRYPQIRYVNRQDDAGDAGLRQAKLTYNPVFILKKYNITF